MKLIESEPDATPIHEEDLVEYQGLDHELDEMEAEDFGRVVDCCRTIPCRFGGCER